MAYQRDVYCEFEFLKKFGDSHPMRRTIAYKVHEAIDEFIFCKSRPKLNIDRTTFATYLEELNPGDFLFDFYDASNMGRLAAPIKFYGEGQCEHKFASVTDLFNDSEERLRNTILLDSPDEGEYIHQDSTQDNSRYAIGREYGTIVLSPDDWSSDGAAEECSYLFKICGKPISRNQKLWWNNVLLSKYNLSCCNSMIIIDNYIIEATKDMSKRVYNLLELLKILIPKHKLQDKFNLTIITTTGDKKFAFNKDDINKPYNEYYTPIFEFLQENVWKICPDCEIDLFVQKNEKPVFHDRYIVTNNAFIKIGAGFDLIDQDRNTARKETDVHIIHPGLLYSFENANTNPDEDDNVCDNSYIRVINNVYNEVLRNYERQTGRWLHYPENRSCANRLILSMEPSEPNANDTKSYK